MQSGSKLALISGAAAIIAMMALTSPAMSADDAVPQGEELEQAALDFMSWCGPCHGRSGQGDGPVAPELKTEPPDLTQLTRGAGGTFPDDDVRKRIDGRDLPTAHGSTDMPVWGYWFTLHETAAGLLQEDRETAEKEVKKRIARLVAYLKTLQK